VWDRPLFSELHSSLRRRKPRIVAHDYGVVRRVELVEIGSRNPNLFLAENDVPRWIDFNHLMVELVADQGVAILQAYCPANEKSRLRPLLSCQRTVTFLSNFKEQGSSQARRNGRGQGIESIEDKKSDTRRFVGAP